MSLSFPFSLPFFSQRAHTRFTPSQSLIKQASQLVGDTFQYAKETAGSFIPGQHQNSAKDAKNQASDAASDAKDKASNAASDAKDKASKMTDDASKEGEKTVDQAHKGLNDLVNDTRKLADNALGQVNEFVKPKEGSQGGLVGTARNVAGTVIDTVQKIVHVAEEKAGEAADAVSTAHARRTHHRSKY